MASHGRKHIKAGTLLGRLQQDTRSLNSSILIMAQKMKYVVRNEKILGRNLIVLNKKLKALEERLASGKIGVSETGEPEGLAQRLEEQSQKIAELETRLQQLGERAASKEELQEMHYVVDSINPLEFVTLEQAKDLIAGRRPRKRVLKKGKR